MTKKLLFPEDARAWLRRRYLSQHRAWLNGEGTWPLSVLLGEPTEKTVAEDAGLVRQWVENWTSWGDAGEVQWLNRQWPRLGTQRLPCRLLLSCAADVARVVGEAQRYERAGERMARLTARWDALSGSPLLLRHFDELADYPAQEFERLFALLTWLDLNRDSSHYLRQLPVEGIDTKWCEAKRRTLITDVLVAMRSLSEPLEFHELCGLRRPPQRLRMRLLCSDARQVLGGLGDVEAPIAQIAALDLRPECALVVENLETGLALPELPGCVAFMKLGNGVGVLSRLPWLSDARVVYWGDIDTYGFAILSQARAVLPSLSSVLMDEETLLRNRALWGREPVPSPSAQLAHLTADEHAVFGALRDNLWGPDVRLEQERVPWPYAVEALRRAVGDRGKQMC
ncbi:MAG: Wadjet anti-phage system protein JetD domain-containing protein [Deltaproteobacteria bacterium]